MDVCCVHGHSGRPGDPLFVPGLTDVLLRYTDGDCSCACVTNSLAFFPHSLLFRMVIAVTPTSDSENDALCGAEGSRRTQQSVSSSAAFNAVDIKDSINNSLQLWFL